MSVVSKKTVLGAAVAALIGAGAIAGSSQAEITKIPGKLVLKAFCAVGFAKGPGTNSYVCRRNFVVVCKQGMSANKPVVTHLGGKSYRVAYSCYYPPK